MHTASSFAHALFRFYALKPGQVFLVSNQSNARKTSKYELEWLSYVAHSENKDIRTAFTNADGQKRIDNYYVDGYEEATNTVLEYQGCIFHGETLAKINMKSCSVCRLGRDDDVVVVQPTYPLLCP